MASLVAPWRTTSSHVPATGSLLAAPVPRQTVEGPAGALANLANWSSSFSRRCPPRPRHRHHPHRYPHRHRQQQRPDEILLPGRVTHSGFCSGFRGGPFVLRELACCGLRAGQPACLQCKSLELCLGVVAKDLGMENGGHRVAAVRCFHDNIQLHYISVFLVLLATVRNRIITCFIILVESWRFSSRNWLYIISAMVGEEI